MEDQERCVGSRANESSGMDDSFSHNAGERGCYSKICFHFLECTKGGLGCGLSTTDGFDACPLRLDAPSLGFDTGSLRFDRPERDFQFVP